MNRLIQNLLDVTRLEASRFLTKPERVSVLEIMRDVLAIETPLASLASVELRSDKSSDIPDVWADRDRLVQIFDNLIGNAVKFTKPGGSIALGAIAHAGEVRFHVEDTGCGIAADQVPHVFDRFWQAPGAARRGAGLGLTIVKGIVEAHGGRVWVQSEPAQGSTFFFTIPTAA
jgi:signal transduction histidine kinase